MSTSSEDMDGGRRHAAVEFAGGKGSSAADSTDHVPSAGSAAADSSSLAEIAIAALPQELAEQANDLKRKARSQDPGSKFGWWPDPTKKEFVQCVFCMKVVPSGIKRFKQHLAGGFGDTMKCTRVPEVVSRDMHAYLKKSTRSALVLDSDEVAEGEDVAAGPVAPEPSSGTKYKQAKKKAVQTAMSSFVVSGPPKAATQKGSKSVAAMLCKSPEEVVADRHRNKASQSTLEHCMKKGKEAKQIVDDHVADFLYENKIPLNVVNSRSWEIMLESIGQYGPGYRGPSYHDVRVPWLERAVERTSSLRSKHEESWEEYGCSLMSDSWTDVRGRHLINFLANSPAGTYFLCSIDASSEIANANMLADLLERQINKIGAEYVVQVVTDNGANYKAAGKLLMERIPHLFWTPCAAHCLDLLLEDIGKINSFSTCINQARKVSRFLYKHGRLQSLMRDKIGGDLVRPCITRFATSFLQLASMYKHKNGLRSLFVSEEWQQSKFSTAREGNQAENIMLSAEFWKTVESCLRASQPILVALRIADGDETPAAPEIMMAMDKAKATIKEALKDKPKLLAEVISFFENRWGSQMEQPLYGAALFLNPGKFFDMREKNRRQAARLRSMFNDVMWKMVSDEDEQTKISKQADDYERSEGECFSKPGAIRDRDKKSPILWWGAYGGLAFELQSLAKRVISLCCSASGCERNWSEFSAIHTKKRNRLEHERLCKLVYVSYNRKMENRFEKIRQQGSKGKRSNPLVLEELMWENEWIHESEEGDELWSAVDDVLGATQATRGRNLPRAAAARGGKTYCETYVRRKRQKLAAAQDLQQGEGDGSGDGDSEDDPQVQELTTNEKDAAEKAIDDEEESGSAGDQFKLDDDLI